MIEPYDLRLKEVLIVNESPMVIFKGKLNRFTRSIVSAPGVKGAGVEKPVQLFGTKYQVTGPVNEKKLQRAISLSENNYCSVSAMLGKTAEITNEYDLL